jgi:Protein of unknown function (DUF2865)
MRNATSLVTVLVAAAAVFGLATGAHAQSVLQKLFGFGSSPPPATGVAPQRYRAIVPQHRFQSRPPLRAASPPAPADDDIGPPDSAGPYTTLCVRTCDGFYFPLRHNARHEHFASDVNACKSTCGTQGRLFYYPSNSPEAADAMIDLAGQPYSTSPHAFAYRKSVVQGCTCKPLPWSSAELARHQSYVDQEASERAKDAAFLKARADTEASAQAPVTAPIPDARPPSSDAIATAQSETQAGAPQPPQRKAQQPFRRRARPNLQRVQYMRVPYQPTASWPLPSLFGNSKPKPFWSKPAR